MAHAWHAILRLHKLENYFCFFLIDQGQTRPFWLSLTLGSWVVHCFCSHGFLDLTLGHEGHELWWMFGWNTCSSALWYQPCEVNAAKGQGPVLTSLLNGFPSWWVEWDSNLRGKPGFPNKSRFKCRKSRFFERASSLRSGSAVFSQVDIFSDAVRRLALPPHTRTSLFAGKQYLFFAGCSKPFPLLAAKTPN